MSDVDEVVRVVLRELRHLSPTTGTSEDWKRHRGLIDVSFAALSLAILSPDHDTKSIALLLLSAFEMTDDKHQNYRNFLTLLDIDTAEHKMISTYEHASDEMGD